MLCERAGEALRQLLAVGLPDAQAAVFEVRSQGLVACMGTSACIVRCGPQCLHCAVRTSKLRPDAVGAESAQPAGLGPRTRVPQPAAAAAARRERVGGGRGRALRDARRAGAGQRRRGVCSAGGRGHALQQGNASHSGHGRPLPCLCTAAPGPRRSFPEQQNHARLFSFRRAWCGRSAMWGRERAQLFREETGAWLVKPMSGMARALCDVAAAADASARARPGKQTCLESAAAHLRTFFSSAMQGAGARPARLGHQRAPALRT